MYASPPESEVRTVCVSSARTDLSGGWRVTAIPTGTRAGHSCPALAPAFMPVPGIFIPRCAPSATHGLLLPTLDDASAARQPDATRPRAKNRRVPQKFLGIVAQRGFAASHQRSAFSDQLLKQRREHAFDLYGFAQQPVVVGLLEELKIARQQKMILQFAGGAASDPAEASQFRIPIPAATLRQVGTNRRTGNGASDWSSHRFQFLGSGP
jgi:hypothetical protein